MRAKLRTRDVLLRVWMSLLFALALSFSAYNASIAQEELPSFRIGVIDAERGPITGGALLAVNEINLAGGVQGADGTRFRLELVIQPPADDGSIETAVNNIRQASVIAVLGPVETEQALDNLALLQGLNVPVLTPAIGDTILASDASGLIFRSRAAEVFQGRALATYLVEDLGLSRITTVQLDVASTAGVVGFTTAISALGAPAQATILYNAAAPLDSLIAEVNAGNPEMTVVYGPPALAAQVYAGLRAANYGGSFAYNQADEAAFRAELAGADLAGILSTDTWSISLTDETSTAFLASYARTLGQLPEAISAATYDSLRLIERALGQPGDLAENLRAIDEYAGVQGLLTPARLARNETSNNVAVLALNPLGGVDVVARFAGGQRVEVEAPPISIATATPGVPTPTPTPEGVVGTVVSDVLNVRTGPGLEYDILGQLRRGEQVRILGANINFTWVVIEFRGQSAWISTASNLLEVFGDRNTVPVVQAPPTPTPAPATLTPTPSGNADIVIVAATPAEIPFNTLTNVIVTVRNVGGQPAGPFAIAASYLPDNYYTAVNVNGLPAGGETNVTLQVQLAGSTGTYQTAIVADLNNQVDEGPTGEANNSVFLHTYRLDRLSLSNIVTLAAGATLDIDGNGTIDVNYSSAGLNTNGPCGGGAYCLGILSPTYTFQTAHYDIITPANGVGTTSILNVSLTPGTTLGVLTDSGKRAVIRVDGINPGVSLNITYRVYP